MSLKGTLPTAFSSYLQKLQKEPPCPPTASSPLSAWNPPTFYCSCQSLQESRGPGLPFLPHSSPHKALSNSRLPNSWCLFSMILFQQKQSTPTLPLKVLFVALFDWDSDSVLRTSPQAELLWSRHATLLAGPGVEGLPRPSLSLQVISFPLHYKNLKFGLFQCLPHSC